MRATEKPQLAYYDASFNDDHSDDAGTTWYEAGNRNLNFEGGYGHA